MFLRRYNWKNETGPQQQSPIHSLSTKLIDGQAKTIKNFNKGRGYEYIVVYFK